MSRLDEIKQRAGMATEGPWWSDELIYVWQATYEKKAKSMVCDFDHQENYLARMRGVGGGRSHEQQKKDMAFIAHARTDIPWLVDRLEKAVNYLRQGKVKFSPNTTNSDVDLFLEEFFLSSRGLRLNESEPQGGSEGEN